VGNSQPAHGVSEKTFARKSSMINAENVYGDNSVVHNKKGDNCFLQKYVIKTGKTFWICPNKQKEKES